MSIQTNLRSYNGIQSWPNYYYRVKSVAKQFFYDDKDELGLVGMQEVGNLFGITEFHGAHILKNEVNKLYLKQADFRAYKSLVTVVSGRFNITKTVKKYLGKDPIRHLFNRSKRRLLGVQLSLLALDSRFWFFTTHLNHGGHEEDVELRQTHILKIIDTIKSNIKSDELPPVIAGDFNLRLPRDNKTFKTLMEHFSLLLKEKEDSI